MLRFLPDIATYYLSSANNEVARDIHFNAGVPQADGSLWLIGALRFDEIYSVIFTEPNSFSATKLLFNKADLPRNYKEYLVKGLTHPSPAHAILGNMPDGVLFCEELQRNAYGATQQIKILTFYTSYGVTDKFWSILAPWFEVVRKLGINCVGISHGRTWQLEKELKLIVGLQTRGSDGIVGSRIALGTIYNEEVSELSLLLSDEHLYGVSPCGLPLTINTKRYLFYNVRTSHSISTLMCAPFTYHNGVGVVDVEKAVEVLPRGRRREAKDIMRCKDDSIWVLTSTALYRVQFVEGE